MDLGLLLANAQSPDGAIRNQAELQLNSATENNYDAFVMALCVELATEGKQSGSRQGAGLYLKNLFTAKDAEILGKKMDKWNQCNPQIKEQIRLGLLQALSSLDYVASHTAAQVVAALAAVEVPANQWPSLLPSLFANVSSSSVEMGPKIASLDALGYMCESMNVVDIEKGIVDQILNTVISGMSQSSPDPLKKAAVSALLNSLDFTESNFALDNERNAIMSAVCSTAQSTDIKVREISYQCLAAIAESYYEHMSPYMATLFPLTTSAIMTDHPSVGMMAIEFWVSIFGVEAEIEEGSLNISQSVASHILPLLLDTLLKQSDSEDDDEWTIAEAGGLCLKSLVQVVGDSIVPFVIAFVTKNIQETNWRNKEAGILAFGTLMESCSTEILHQYVASASNFLLLGIVDANSKIRDTSAWTIGQMLGFHLKSIAPDQVPVILNSLMVAIDDQHVPAAKNAINSISYFASAFADDDEGQSNNHTNGLSPYVPALITKLLLTAAKPECEVSVEAYEAASTVIENSAIDQSEFIFQVLVEAVTRLEQSFNSTQASNERATSQILICGVINTCSRKLPSEAIAKCAQNTLSVLLKVLSSDTTNAHEEVFMALGFIAEKLGPGFDVYMPHFAPFYIKGLKQLEETSLCLQVISSITEVCKSLKKSILQYSDLIIAELLNILQSDVAHRDLKPFVIGVFADFALTLNGDFDRYINPILSILHMAQMQEYDANNDDEDLIEYIDQLRCAILDAYTGILSGFQDGGKLEILFPHVENIFSFLAKVVRNENVSSRSLCSAIGLIGDSAIAFGNPLLPIISQPFIQEAIGQAILKGQRNDDQTLRETTKYAQGAIEKVRMNK